jgi:hypothetical protein
MRVDRGKVANHAAAPRIIERMRDLCLASEESVHVDITLMRALRRVASPALDFIHDLLAEPFESHFTQLAKHPRVDSGKRCSVIFKPDASTDDPR